MSEEQKAVDRLAAHVPSWLTVLALLTAMVIVVSAAVVLIYGAVTGKVVEAFGIVFVDSQSDDGSEAISSQLFTGAVVAFDVSDGCPEGWRPFEEGQGRFLVGVGQDDGLENRSFRAKGGKDSISLEVEHLPYHEHDISLPGRSGSNAFVNRNPAWGFDDWQGEVRTTSTSLIRGAQRTLGRDHEPTKLQTMPPFIALHFCKKVS